MKVLLLGVGMQGKAALHDLVTSGEVESVIAADYDLAALQAHVERWGYGHIVHCEGVDAARPESLDPLMVGGVDVVVDLLPVAYHGQVAAAAVRHGVHLVNSSYVGPEVAALAAEAESRGVTILPEFGMDPGIDLVLLGEAVRSLDRVDDIITYGAGFPEAQAAGNPLKYKVTWTFDGVLRSYRRAGRLIRDGRVVEFGADDTFNPEHLHQLEIEELGLLEAYPNGDALKYAALLKLDPSELRNLGRYVLRWPGHAAFWKALVDLHLLDDEPVLVDGLAVDRVRYLAAVIEPHIQYGADERDLVVVRVDVRGIREDKPARVVYQLIDRRDLQNGFTAMSRTVGYTASIGALMIGAGTITQRGLLSPLTDIPYEPFARALEQRNIQVTRS